MGLVFYDLKSCLRGFSEQKSKPKPKPRARKPKGGDEGDAAA